MALPCVKILASSIPDSLNILGRGIEIMPMNAIAAIVDPAKEHFETQYFTASERSAAEIASDRIHYFAGRICAKKAVMKALGMELQEAFWLDIEVQRLPTGEPLVVLHGRCREITSGIGLTNLLLSISHETAYAAASVIALGRARVKGLS
ncbi:4'-phosphopantetheinyl transferase superfamily protein [Chroococcidiopsis sp. FACHB-1243]|uniref:holo-ACP synthase n=1 Tax=Chroococcidiopsis sp. [FACHB-1243] TaxID=2692781 RepID=UPI00177CDD2A|nr:4'-phosphopantetheinyl transferase superfamily protein [Chroococcidiopsis sp. [FACHB-1243]]MBD2309020.1 4'-phosphopantetheinyl transferase superfamily protein [Chroococcidiopsis sp. [FACHB-1243]]